MPDQDEALLKEIRDNHDYAKREWHDIYEEGRKDMCAVAGDPWPTAERTDREAAGRLCLTLDEIGQYLNQCINEVRQNKRAIKISPEGNGATDATAEMRAAMIKGIEYKSRSQYARIRAFENLIQRSFGFYKVTIDYESPRSKHRILKTVSIPNPESILVDPAIKEPDGEDMDFAFELDTMYERIYRQKYPDAEIRSFTPEHQNEAPSWITDTDAGKRIQIAAYWKRKSTKRKLLFFDNGESKFLDELQGANFKPDRGNAAILKYQGQTITVPDWRPTLDLEVCQYVTNGLEILETNPWGGTTIPIIPMFGKELFVSKAGAEAKRVIESYVRKARDPFLLYCFACTAQAEMVGMSPKVPYEGYEGQFATSTDWENLNKKLVPYVEFKAVFPGSGDTVLPLPKKNQWEPPIQALEIVRVGAKQAVQASMGITGQLSGRRGQSLQAKSGVALEKVDEMESQGTYHFIESYDRAVAREGRIMDEMLDIVYDLPREVGVIKKNDEPAVAAINQPGKHPETGDPMNFQVGEGDHGVTISVGPSSDSQRQEQSDFADHLVANAALLGPAAPKILALSIKLKALGPIGDEMAEILDPSQKDQGKVTPEQLQALQQELDHVTAFAQKLHNDIQAKQPEIDARLHIAAEAEKTKRVLGLAMIQSEEARAELEQELGIAHKAVDQRHETKLKLMDQGHDQSMQDGSQDHEAGLEASGQEHESQQSEADRQHASVQSDADRTAAAMAKSKTVAKK